MEESQHKNATPKDWRERMRRPLLLLAPLVVVVGGLFFYFGGGRYETTDNAYVQTARVAISADVSGRVVEIAIRDNQVVHRGDLLFRLNDVPYRVVVEEAGARLANARLQVETLKANYRQHRADWKGAEDTLKFRQGEYDRQIRLLDAGIATPAQVDQAMHALDEARAQLAGIKQQIDAVVASLAENPDIAPEDHPEVRQAQALFERAELDLSYTVIRAPSDGIVTRVEALQVGSYVKASVPVFALVSDHDVWIEANFKENQLAQMRPGQTVEIEIDRYRGKTFLGKVASVSPGTGAQFSVLPPENATGNWVKVVQRLPVRIELDRIDPAYPLQGGLSAYVSVDTRSASRSALVPDENAVSASGNAR